MEFQMDSFSISSRFKGSISGGSKGFRTGPSISCKGGGGREPGPDRVQASTTVGSTRTKRGRSPADKENKRIKRLLRNRVLTQKARERKKAYLTYLQVKVKELEKNNGELEERLSTLQNESQMLRHNEDGHSSS
ncbi:hypothetical protein C5167_040832 [Papaver somniferum]|uniref:BZIP domain-containing protein n=1 Tax=Papaver somniferum TaxID=3469 RepID=A0A4Y7IJJ8_PAPSO|nr:hypothetical protein C5167_040832 [Papaver somniferum]